MSFLRLIARNLAGHRRMHAGLLLGAVLTCAILTGALLVGASVKQTLHDQALARLGNTAYALNGGSRYFAQTLSDTLTQANPNIHPSAALALPGMVTLPPGGKSGEAPRNRVTVLGVDAGFWRFAQTPPKDLMIGPQEAALDRRTAAALGVKAGSDVLLRVVRKSLMPQDAPLAANDKKNVVSVLVTVKAVLSDAQLGRFSLLASQAAAHNVFVDRAWLQDQVELASQANLLLADGAADLASLQAGLEQAWQLEHAGLRLRSHASGAVQLESDRIFIEEPVVQAALKMPGAAPTLTYLVNSIAKGDRSTPYSFVEAGATPADLPDDQVIINQWLSEQIDAKSGDKITLAYMQPTASNTLEERTHKFTVREVAPMAAMTLERELAPQFAGLSEVENCRDWDIGLPMDKDKLADPANEAYWKAYGQTPKLLASYAAGKALWGTRFGAVTAVRFTGSNEAAVRKQLRGSLKAADLGLGFLPVREQALNAVNQAMDFGGLFLGMSFFLIIAALVLLALLYVFGLQQRAQEMGLLLALGFSLRRVRVLYLLESMPTAVAGAVLGAAAGAGYAALLLAGLARFWSGAVAGAEITFHATPAVLFEGGGMAFACVMVTVWVTLWRGTRRTAVALLTTDQSSLPPVAEKGRGRPWALLLSTLALLSSLGWLTQVWLRPPNNLQEPFFGAGSLLLLAALGYYGAFLGHLSRRPSSTQPRWWRLALANLVRRRGRSLSVAAVTACGCFMVFAVSAMQENLSLHAVARSSGTGGFALYAESTAPLLGAPDKVAAAMDAAVAPLRVRDGEDASCLNLNHAQTPRLLGVDAAKMRALGAFAPPGGAAQVWKVLEQPLPGGEIPALVGDLNTAQWGLKKKTGPETGDVLAYRDEQGREVRVKLVGALPMRLSVFQGAILINEQDFARLYPAEAGYRAFLIDADGAAAGTLKREQHTGGPVQEMAARLNREFEKQGMEAAPAVDRLQQFYAVESTYLTMFLVLGGFGLVLGAGGAGIVVLRNLYERRSEIALLHALGYTPGRVVAVLLVEQVVLVLAGVVIGSVTAFAAVLPLVLLSQTRVSLALQLGLLAAIVAAHALSLGVSMRVGLPQRPMEGLRGE